MRYIEFHNNEYYHIYNRGVDKREIFCDERDYLRFLWNLRLLNNGTTKMKREYLLKNYARLELNSGYPELSSWNQRKYWIKLVKHLDGLPKYISVISYCLNPNHYHIVLKQLIENGITKFMHKLSSAYTNFFNKKYKRTGSLFESRFRAVKIITDEQLLYLSGYLNGNPEIHGICPAEKWSWSSLQDYIELRNGTLCNKDVIMNQFLGSPEYLEYVKMVINNSRAVKDAMREYYLE